MNWMEKINIEKKTVSGITEEKSEKTGHGNKLN